MQTLINRLQSWYVNSPWRYSFAVVLAFPLCLSLRCIIILTVARTSERSWNTFTSAIRFSKFQERKQMPHCPGSILSRDFQLFSFVFVFSWKADSLQKPTGCGSFCCLLNFFPSFFPAIVRRVWKNCFLWCFFRIVSEEKRKHWLKFIFLDVFNDNNGSFLSETKSKKEPLTISRIIVLAANLSRVVLRVIAVSLTSNWITRDTRERLVFTKRLLEQPVFFFLGPALDRGRSFDSQATVRIDANGIVSASGKRIISSHALHSRVNFLSINSHCSWCFVELFIYSVWTFLRAVRTTTCSFVNVDFQLVRMKRNQFSGDDAIHPAWLKYYFNWLPRAPWDAN